MRFTLKIDSNNDAFVGEERPVEVARLLVEVSQQIKYQGRTEGTLFDVNGNSVGQWYFGSKPR